MGQRGIWRDKARLGAIPGAPEGITVAILDNGLDYNDQVDGVGIRYTYPSGGGPGANAGDILATKRAYELALPIFVITTERGTTNRRNIRLGWVAGADDEAAVFDIRFDNASGEPGDWVSGDVRLQFDAIRRFDRACAVCFASDAGRLHVVPLDPTLTIAGADVARLVLCTHHRQMHERSMFTIDAASLQIVPRDGLTLEGMSITRSDLSHLTAMSGASE